MVMMMMVMMMGTNDDDDDDDDDDGAGGKLYSRWSCFGVYSLVLCGFVGVPLCVIHFMLVLMKMYRINVLVVLGVWFRKIVG